MNALTKLNDDDEPKVDRSLMETATTRAAQEVQAAMVIAKKFPRDENASFARIMKACNRKGLAEAAEYAYPRGGTTVSGPSIRLAEVLAQSWGNIDFGVLELEQKNNESIVMSYCWDLETNTRQTKVFSVKHERHTKHGVTKLTDPRDLYEMVANQGARRLRACILGIIPGDVTDAAVAACNKTMEGNGSEPIADRVRVMLTKFEPLGVTQAMIETRIGHKLDAIIEAELAQLRKIYNTLTNGSGKREDFFQLGGASEGGKPKFVPVEDKKPEATEGTGAAPQEESAKPTEPQSEHDRNNPPTDPDSLVKWLDTELMMRSLNEKEVIAICKSRRFCGSATKISEMPQSGRVKLAAALDEITTEIGG